MGRLPGQQSMMGDRRAAELLRKSQKENILMSSLLVIYMNAHIYT